VRSLYSDTAPSWFQVRPKSARLTRTLAAVARNTLAIASSAAPKRPVLVNGAAGVVVIVGGQLFAMMGFTVSGGKVTEIDAIVDPGRLRHFDLSVLGGD
jgi:hypothetical protein